MDGTFEIRAEKHAAKFARFAGMRLLDLIYPPLCALCRAPVGGPQRLCASCWAKITFLDGACCGRCGFPFEFDAGAGALCAPCQAHPPAFDQALAVMRYEPASRDVILAFKRADRLDLAPLLGRWLGTVGRDFLARTDVVVPVPLHWSRLWSRRYNQSAVLARCLSRQFDIPCETGLLIRTRATPSQGRMPSAQARRRNVRGAFRVRPNQAFKVNGRTVLLVDDVYTTGSTLNACAKSLKGSGARNVLVLTLARVVRPMGSLI